MPDDGERDMADLLREIPNTGDQTRIHVDGVTYDIENTGLFGTETMCADCLHPWEPTETSPGHFNRKLGTCLHVIGGRVCLCGVG